ncbi:sugar ABC transporter permease [Parafrigoribacterium mesophilum]|uniref:carbohydrate ABC transporter permease n=1 Tax=Parafrigoribacterium mesophilum TaxID=433646 RepID=UPI0031FDC543
MPDRRRPGGLARTDGWWPWAFVAPLFLGVCVFYLWPILQTIYFSFTKFGVFGGQTWIGADNWVRLFQDPDFYRAILNTLIYSGIVLLGIPVAVFLASLINRPGLKFSSLYRVLFFLPYIAMPVAISLVWRMMFNGDFGIINYVLSVVGIDGPHWLSTPGLALISVSLVGFWGSFGLAILILGAGLKNIPTELYEAAELDGASPWRRFRSVTVPLLSPSIFFITIITIIGSFQLFDALYAMLGPNNPVMPATQSLVFYFYETGFIRNDKGFAATIALAILVIIGIVTFLQFRLQKRWVNYD